MAVSASKLSLLMDVGGQAIVGGPILRQVGLSCVRELGSEPVSNIPSQILLPGRKLLLEFLLLLSLNEELFLGNVSQINTSFPKLLFVNVFYLHNRKETVVVYLL